MQVYVQNMLSFILRHYFSIILLFQLEFNLKF